MAKRTAKESKSAPAKREPMKPETRAMLKKIAVNCACAMLFAGACFGGFKASKQYVDKITRTPLPPTVVIKDQPVWMSKSLANQIISTVRPSTPFAPDNHQMLVDRATILAGNPWVKKVNAVRRAYNEAPGDTIEIDCEFRAPVALAKWQDSYWYVDSEGVRLPEKLSAEQVSLLIKPGTSPMFHIIDGINSPPQGPGKVWPGGDIKAGIELIALLTSQNLPKQVSDQIVTIDVSNFGGKINPNESQINLLTRYKTQVRWGQPPSSKAFFVELDVKQKLNYLVQALKQTGRVDMNQDWIDLRFDSLTVPDRRSQANIKPDH